jgi:hypothetical protein
VFIVASSAEVDQARLEPTPLERRRRQEGSIKAVGAIISESRSGGKVAIFTPIRQRV